MSSANGSGDLSSEMEVDAFRRLFPLRFHERHLLESVRPDGMEGYWEKLEVQQWPLTMLAAIKMEVMTPTVDSQDEGYIALASSLAYFLLLFFLDIQPQMFWHDQYEGIITGQWESYLDGLTGNVFQLQINSGSMSLKNDVGSEPFEYELRDPYIYGFQSFGY
ncbi:unnamed protein product [Ilex paraguariensis]|uniref:Uncharacterized protein n=1 Tax=Ilex paraguariensis TaxID=185542 RepID=A0ABC8SKD2_9AQUA